MCRKIKLVMALIILLVVSIITSVTHGQRIELNPEESGGMGYSMLGSGFLSISDLNARLESNGYSAISGGFFSVGGGGHGIFNNKWIIGGEGHTLMGGSDTDGNYSTSLIVNQGFFDVGYILYSTGDLRAYPIIGLGAGTMRFSLSEDLTSLTFDQLLNNPGRNSEISKSGLLLNFALGADYLFSFMKSESERGGLLLGLRAGYCISPFKGHWNMGDIEISGAPDLGFAGPYIRFMIGGGAFGVE